MDLLAVSYKLQTFKMIQLFGPLGVPVLEERPLVKNGDFYIIVYLTPVPSGGACLPPRWCELLVGRPPPLRNGGAGGYPTHSR